MNSAKSAFLASRPFSWVNTAFPFVVGWLVSGGTLSPLFFIATFFFLFPYNLAMYGINDIFDYESDLLNPRKASLEGALLSPRHFMQLWVWIVVCTVPLAGYLYASGSLVAAGWLTFSLFMVVAYSAKPFRFKEVPFLDSFTSACHFVTPFIYALALQGSLGSRHVLILLAYAIWAAASHAFGAVQDTVFDREGGIGSVSTVFGAAWTVRLSTIGYVCAALITFFMFPTVLGGGAAVGVLLYAVNTGRFWNVTDEKSPKTNAGWRLFLALNMGLGAFLTNVYVFSLGDEPIWLPFIVALVTYALFFWFLQKSGQKK